MEGRPGKAVLGKEVPLPSAWQNLKPLPFLLHTTKDERASPTGWHRLQVTTAT